MKKLDDRNMLHAFFVGALLAVGFLVSVIFIPLLFLLIIFLISIKAYMEISKVFNINFPIIILSFCSLGIFAISYFLGIEQLVIYFFSSLLILALYSSVTDVEVPFLQKFPEIIFSYIYIALSLSMSLLILKHKGYKYLIFLVIVMVFSDMAGHFFGIKFGKHKLAKIISPNKTWEGLIAGIIIASIVSVLYSSFVLHRGILFGVLLGVGISIIGTFGDLCESVLKRSANLKDFGKILKGHGGVLDRFDGLLLLLPIFYLVVSFL